MAQLDAQSIINYIGTAPKKTPVKVYVKGTDLKVLTFPAEVEAFVEQTTGVLFGDWQVLKPFLAEHEADFAAVRVENAARNSAVPLLDLKEVNARIEPGVTIRDQVLIGDNAVIMMGAVINIGAEIGEGTMIDMGASVAAPWSVSTVTSVPEPFWRGWLNRRRPNQSGSMTTC